MSKKRSTNKGGARANGIRDSLVLQRKRTGKAQLGSQNDLLLSGDLAKELNCCSSM